MTTPAPYSHNATSVVAIQFDGTVPTLLTIFEAATDPANLQVSLYFGPDGRINTAVLSGQMVSLSMAPTDWILIPTDTTLSPFVAPDVDFQRDWSAA